MAINPEMEVNAGPNASQKRARELYVVARLSLLPLLPSLTFVFSSFPPLSLSLFIYLFLSLARSLSFLFFA